MTLDADRLILIARSLGFSRLGVVALDHADVLAQAMTDYRDWLAMGYAGDMDYLVRHADLRADPAQLLKSRPTQLRAIVVTMDYLPAQSLGTWRDAHAASIRDPARAMVSVYAHGRDYHKVLRSRLAQLAQSLSEHAQGQYQFRACVDSAPVLEVELARRCGLGWRGKHTLLLNRSQGSMFFLGVLLTDMPLSERRYEPEESESRSGHCGNCTSCLDACPTQAFVEPYRLDARRCISYLTIEHAGSIPESLRPLIGNRVYGCDDCQQVCPWNQYAQVATVNDFDVRNGLNESILIDLMSWSEQEFMRRHQGSAILRIGYERWLRNLAVAAGNALSNSLCSDPLRGQLIEKLQNLTQHASEIVREHAQWAIERSVIAATTGHTRS